MHFLYLQRGLESRPCRIYNEILYIIVHVYNACVRLCLLYVNQLEKSPPPPPLHAIDNSTSTFTLYFKYRKPPTISPGLIYFRKRFLMGLYKGGGGGLYTGGLIHGRSFVLVINKSDINKSVINREINVY